MGKKEKNYYFETFIKSVSYCHDAAAMLRDCFDNYTSIDLPKSIEAMHDIEHAADEIKHEMMNRLVKEFLPPLEREDIVELAHAIDDVTDSIEDVLLGMYMSNTTELREDAKTFAKISASPRNHCGDQSPGGGGRPSLRRCYSASLYGGDRSDKNLCLVLYLRTSGAMLRQLRGCRRYGGADCNEKQLMILSLNRAVKNREQ